MYPEELVAPMRTDLTVVGFDELKTPADVDSHLEEHSGTSLVVINSVAVVQRELQPAVKMALANSEKKPDKLATVFAGVDMEATARAREFTAPYPPSSPSIALFKNGELVHFIERHHIEGRNAEMIAHHLIDVFEEYC